MAPGSTPATAADREQKCQAQRSTRVALAARYAADLLPTGGLTHAEVARDKRAAASKARWDALSPEGQARRRSNLRPKHGRPADSEADLVKGLCR